MKFKNLVELAKDREFVSLETSKAEITVTNAPYERDPQYQEEDVYTLYNLENTGMGAYEDTDPDNLIDNYLALIDHVDSTEDVINFKISIFELINELGYEMLLNVFNVKEKRPFVNFPVAIREAVLQENFIGLDWVRKSSLTEEEFQKLMQASHTVTGDYGALEFDHDTYTLELTNVDLADYTISLTATIKDYLVAVEYTYNKWYAK